MPMLPWAYQAVLHKDFRCPRYKRTMKAYNFMAKDPTEWLSGTLQGSVNNEGRERQCRDSHRIDAAV